MRSWIIISENEYSKLLLKVDELSAFIGCNELKWSSFSHNNKYFNYFNDISFRIFITVSSPADILWQKKYRLTKNFDSSICNFDFGEIDENLTLYIKDRIFRDLKNALFLNFYEKHHIENAKKGIEKVILAKDYELIYRVDPPQMSVDGWKSMLQKVSGTNSISIEFPKSNRTQGIQFADIVAGCFRSLLLEDSEIKNSVLFLKEIKNRLIRKDATIPNPNLIFFNEINDDIKNKCKKIWGY